MQEPKRYKSFLLIPACYFAGFWIAVKAGYDPDTTFGLMMIVGNLLMVLSSAFCLLYLHRTFKPYFRKQR